MRRTIRGAKKGQLYSFNPEQSVYSLVWPFTTFGWPFTLSFTLWTNLASAVAGQWPHFLSSTRVPSLIQCD